MSTTSSLAIITISVLGAVPALGRTIPNDSGSALIVGGVEANKGEFPFIISIRKEAHHCGGSILNAEWVVTAAHCVMGSESHYTIVAGDHDNNVDEGTEQNRSVSRIILHPEYNPLMNENDVALLHMSSPFEFNEFVQPVDIAEADFTFPPTEVVAGWGRLKEAGSSPTVLMKVEVPFVSEEACKEAYGSRILESMVCAGEGGKDACQGDSGGPLLCDNAEGKVVLCGIVSWGTGCARPDKPGVYSNVPYFHQWLFSTILAGV